jgi:hypothetical protein
MVDNFANTGSSDPNRRRRDTIRAATKGGGRTKAPGDERVFVAYAREDKEPTRKLVQRLRGSGADVIWDEDFAAGSDIDMTIRQAITSAKAVIVVWSMHSAHSRFVRDEASLALKDNKLLPTHVDGFDPEDVPMGFGTLHTVAIETPGLVETSLASYGIALEANKT